MQIFSLEPGQKAYFPVLGGFSLERSMMSVKVTLISEADMNHTFRFVIRAVSATGHRAEKRIELQPPHFFAIGRLFNDIDLPNLDRAAWQYLGVEIESTPENPSTVVQVGFTNKLDDMVLE